MLTLKRYPGQFIEIGKDIQIIVLEQSKGYTHIGIEASVELRLSRVKTKSQDINMNEILPRLTRFMDTPTYLGINKNHFNFNMDQCNGSTL